MIVTRDTVPQLRDLLKQKRKGKRWSMAKMGQKIHCSFATVSQIERGVCGLKIETLADMCAALGLEIEVREVRG